MIKIKVLRAEQQVIRKTHPMWKTIDHFCFKSKSLYNYANYILRQEFCENGKYIKYYDMAKELKTEQCYKDTMSQPAQCTLQVLDRNWKSFFASIKDYKKNPNKYLGMPKPPKYLKKDGRFPWFIKNNASYIKDGEVHFRVRKLHGYNWKTNVKGRLICVRFIPRGNCYVMEIVYEIELEDKIKEVKNIIGVDLGVNNFATITNNIGIQPIIINGKVIKSINQFYNKRLACEKSNLIKRNKKYWSNKLDDITFKRNQRMRNYLHNASSYIIKHCIDNNIDTIVIGYNKEWKQNNSIGQAFHYIPYNLFMCQMQYKCENNNINYIETEESYTSGTSFLDNESPVKENYNKSRRIKRGLFKSDKGLINSDVNGSLQIIKKVFPNAFSYGIEGVLNPVVINVI